MADLGELQSAMATARTARDAARANLRQSSLNLQTVEQALALARRGSPRSVGELERQREQLIAQVASGQGALAQSRANTAGVIAQFFTDPRELISGLDDSFPLLLFPVRIETKFRSSRDANALLVRIFPDDIAMAHHEKELTVAERDAGTLYWRALALANATIDADQRTRICRGAWDMVATRHGAYRAGWITKTTQPTNWSDKITDPAELMFPDVPTKPLAWSDAPRSPVLPDVFVVVLERGSESRSVVGNLIPDDLPLGPDPMQVDGFLTRDKTTGRLNVSDDLRWLVDFNAAVAVGMGIRIPISADEAVAGFDRILVVGLRLSSDNRESAALFSRLIESHRYSQGFAIVPQGTPTNNTDDAASGLPTGVESVDETFALEQDPTPLPLSSEPMKQPDGQRLADALGLDYDFVRTVPNSRRMDIAEAVAMDRALWSATIGNFLNEMLKGAFSPGDIVRVRLFFTEFVHGRGLVPAVRAGSQPYGILISSSFDDWTWSELERGDDGDFWDRLKAQLGILRQHWRLAADSLVKFVGKRDVLGNLLDPFDTLLNIIGLEASSVEYWSRTAVPDSYIAALAAYRGNDPNLVNLWIANARNTRILDLGNAHLPASDQARIKNVLFLDTADPVTSPVVDGDPVVPLSETRSIRPYDGALGHNYIDWLVNASYGDVQAGRFTGADGKPVAEPDALLYKMLRVSTLSELHIASRGFIERFRADIFVGAPEPGDTPNIVAPVLMPGQYALVDTSKIGVTVESMTSGDYLLGQARAPSAIISKPPEAAPLAALTDALRILAPLPTARLERLFAEHVDAVSYRLDAWLTGMFARRLAIQRFEQRNTGSPFLGAYGWITDVRPVTDKQPVAMENIPPDLRPAVDGPVSTFRNNGGFVHTPSLVHAVTAAVLRNAYLTHAEQTRADRMAVNLSSARVRTAIQYIEGLQNGQDLGALLGYQLERGMHEGHPGVELDQFVYVLRARFPLLSKKLTPAPDGSPSEVVEARNVVNGYDLLDFAKGKPYPYGIEGLPPAGAQADAIAQEVENLRNAMDSVADLVLSESVHQVVQGNYDRARGSVQALTEGDLPPLPDVVETPRNGKSLTHRVTVFFDLASTVGWNAEPTPRAAANAALNHWLTSMLPAPADIQWMVTAGTQASEFIDLTSLKLEPLDLVLMSGDRVGNLSSKLEQLLVTDYRLSHGIADDVLTFFFTKSDPGPPDALALVFDPNRAQPGKLSLGGLLPLLKALRRLATASRPVGAKDLMRPTEAQHSHPEDPDGYDRVELKARVENTHAALSAHHTALQTLIAAMQPLVDALNQDPGLAVQPAWSTLIPQLRDRLRAVLMFGVPEAMPPGGQVVTRTLAIDAAGQAAGVEAVVAKRLAQAQTLLDTSFPDPLPSDPAQAALETGRRVRALVEAHTEAARQALGVDFLTIPAFTAHSEGVTELNAAMASPVESDPLAIESWLQSLASVRPAMAAWDTVAMYQEWLRGGLTAFVPIQLPVSPGAKWIGGVFGDTVTADDVVSIAANAAPASFGARISGLLVDEWSELVPSATQTTGIALNVNRPNAVAPQALLLAVAPRQTGHWIWEDLINILHDTMDRARLRAVEPDYIKYPYFQVLPPIVTAFDHSLLMAAAKFSSRATSIALQT
jgi:hypothetical protein